MGAEFTTHETIGRADPARLSSPLVLIPHHHSLTIVPIV
jgi:hypothetical protein